MRPAGGGTARPAWTALAAATLLAAFVAANLWWMRGHLLSAPPPWDQGLYLFLSLRYLHAWEDGGAPGLLREVRHLAEPQPPLLPLSALPLYRAFSDARLVAYSASSLFGALLLSATALLARRRSGDAGALLALVLGATWTAPLMLSRDYQMDLPAAALLAAAVLAIEWSDGFARRGPALLAGALAGLMLLAKTMAAPFLAGPALHALARSRREGPIAANAALAAGVAAALASVWWVPHFGSVVRYLTYYGWGEGASPYDPTGGGSLASLRNVGYYVVAFANEGASVAFFAMALVLLGVEAHRTRREGGGAGLDGLLWTWLACGYVLLTLARNKASDRYLVFVIPPVLVLVTSALLRQSAGWKRVAVSVALLAGAANYVSHTWPASGVHILKWHPPLGLSAYVPRKTWLRTVAGIPDGNWPTGAVVTGLGSARIAYQDHLRAALVERALADPPEAPEDQIRRAFRALLRREPDPEALRLAVASLRDGTRTLPQQVAILAASPEAALRPLRTLVLPDHAYVNAGTLRYQAEWARAPVVFVRLEPGRPPPDLEDFDAVVVKTGIPGPDVAAAWAGVMQERLGGSRFRLLPARYWCPDDSEVRLYFLEAPVPH